MSEYAADDKMEWLAWLHRVAPDCPYTTMALNGHSGEYPDLEVDREFDLDSPRWYVGRIERQSPWTAEELLGRPAREWLPQLVGFDSDDPFGPSLHGLSDRIKEAATQGFDWGIALADAFIDGEHWDVPLWEALLRAWETDLGEAEYRQVLSRLSHPHVHRLHARSTCQVLAKLVSGGGRPYAAELLNIANELALSLWEDAREDADPSDRLDWFTLAINRAAGPLAQFWLGSLSIALREQRVERGKLADPFRAGLDAIIRDETPAGAMGRAELMTGFAFLLSVDEVWTCDHLVPPLTEAPQSDNYQAAWDGLLYGQLSVPTIDVLTEPFQVAAANAQGFRAPHTRQQFVNYLAWLVIDFVDDPIDEWIPRFLLNAGEEDRRRFAWAIWRRQGEMSDAEQQELWNRWLRHYWENRVDGVPTPLEDVEVEWMQNWLPQLHSLFAEGVKLALRMPSSGAHAFRLIRRLKEGDQCEREPTAVADLLIQMANSKSATRPFFGWRELIERLMQTDLTADRRQSLQELRIRMGI